MSQNTPEIEAELVLGESQALIRRESQTVAPANLFGAADAVAVVEKAGAVASALKDVVRKQGLLSNISGKEYPRCEAWTMLGTMLGVFPVLVWTRRIEGGWEARVEARTRDGAVIGAAEAECLKSESNWANRDDFALRSMAQTRATAKALRMPLGFVMTLAGYEATPAEEMVSDHPKAARKPAGEPGGVQSTTPPPKNASTVAQAPKPTASVPFPTPESRQKMIAALKAGPTEPNREIVLEYFRKLENPAALLPNEELESLELRFVPATVRQMTALAAKLAEFGNGERAAWAFPPHIEPDGTAKPSKPPVAATPKPAVVAPKDPEWWRDVIISLPRKGMKRDEYLKNPDTIGRLFALRHGNDEEAQAARQRLFGLIQWEPKPREFKGKIYQPTDADWKTYEAVQAFAAWFSQNHPDEQL